MGDGFVFGILPRVDQSATKSAASWSKGGYKTAMPIGDAHRKSKSAWAGQRP
jgi:hypothetical protein